MRHAKHPVCQCASGRIGQCLGHDLALLRDLQRAPEISGSYQKDVETAKQPELMVRFIKRFREFESTSQCGADLLAVARGEQRRQPERCLQFHLATAPATGTVDCCQSTLRPALTLA